MTWISDFTVEHLRKLIDAPDLVGTRYRVGGRIGTGGMGAVFRAHDDSLDRAVALKVMHAAVPAGEMVARLTNEAKTIAALEHPSIVPVHDVGRLEDGRAFYVMKLVEGETLADYRAKAPPVNDRLRLILRLTEAVAFAHERGVIHRDIKPENVMVGAFGELFLMDWGISKQLAEAAGPAGGAAAGDGPPAVHSPTCHGAVLGTPAYMAPEQARGDNERVGIRSDVYALGALLHFLLTGRPPGEPRDRRRELAPWPRPLRAVVARALADDPDDRYESAQALGADVARHLDGRPVAAYPENVVEKMARWSRNNLFVVYLVLAYLVLRMALVFFVRR